MQKNANKTIFSKEEMEHMVSYKILPVLNKDSVFFYNNQGIDMNKCESCKHWLHLRTLFHFTDGLMTGCVPCNKDQSL